MKGVFAGIHINSLVVSFPLPLVEYTQTYIKKSNKTKSLKRGSGEVTWLPYPKTIKPWDGEERSLLSSSRLSLSKLQIIKSNIY